MRSNGENLDNETDANCDGTFPLESQQSDEQNESKYEEVREPEMGEKFGSPMPTSEEEKGS